MNKHVLHHWLPNVSALLITALCMQSTAMASSWDPTLLVNTESFMEIDAGDGTDIYIQFGDDISRNITYNISATEFSFGDDINISGGLSASGFLTVNSDQTGDAQLTFGNNIADQAITLSEDSDNFAFSTGATFSGNISGSTITIDSLQNCDTIDTDAEGNFICGTDASQTATDLYVDEYGDTMEGGLNIDIDTFTGSLLQPDDATLTANLVLWLDAAQIIGLNDNDAVSSWTDASGNGNSVLQTTSGYQPTYQTNEIGGNPVVRFDGTDDYLQDATASYNARTIFIVQRISSATQQTSDLGQIWGNYGDGVHVALDARQTEGYYSFDGNGSAQARCGTNGDSLGSTLLNGLACDWNYDTSQIHRVEFSVDEPLTATTIGSLFPAFSVGAHQYGGDIAEIIVYDRVLTDQEQEGVVNGLSGKYNIDVATATEALNKSDAIALNIVSESTNGPGINIDIQGDSDSPHILFGSGGIADTNLYRSAPNTLHTDDTLTVSGSVAIGNSLSGATIDGFGLTDCDAPNEKLTWNSSTQQFICDTEAISTIFYAYDDTGGLTIDNTQQTIDLGNQVFADSIFTHSETVNPSEVTVTQTGIYRILAQACLESISNAGGPRGKPNLMIQRDTGGGFIDIPGALSSGYIREPQQVTGENLNIEIFQTLDAGDSIQMVLIDTNSNEPNEETIPECSRLLIQLIR